MQAGIPLSVHQTLPSFPRSLSKVSSPRDRRKQVADLEKLLLKTKQDKKFSQLNKKIKTCGLLSMTTDSRKMPRSLGYRPLSLPLTLSIALASVSSSVKWAHIWPTLNVAVSCEQ